MHSPFRINYLYPFYNLISLQLAMFNTNQEDIILNIKTPSRAAKKEPIAVEKKADVNKEKYQKRFMKEGWGDRSGSRPQRSFNKDSYRSKERKEGGENGEKQQTNPEGERPYNNRPKKPSRVVTGNIDLPEQLIAVKEVSVKKNIYPLSDFNLHESLSSSLTANHLEKLTQIQSISFEPLNSHKNSILKAETGSGKTLSYLIPIVNQILNDKLSSGRDCGTVALVICPTRQLCIQAEKQAWKCLKRAVFIVPGTLMGGEAIKKQKARLRKGISILFCTPGRLDYHLKNTTSFKLNKLKFIVFQEADRTLDYGFQKDINAVIEYLQRNCDFEQIQKILVSAHFNQKIESLLKSMDEVSNFKFIGFNETKQTTQAPIQKQTKKEINISKSLKQNYVLVSEDERVPFLASYLSVLHQSKILIFLSTIDEVEYFYYLFNTLEFRDNDYQLTGDKISNRTMFKLHGDINQKQRSKTYFEFKKSHNSILFSTEVASRGLDFPDLTHIVLYDVPPTLTDYANRIGRTARMNSSGVSLLLLNYQESDYVEQLKVYTPNINPIEKYTIFDKFKQILQKRHIGDQPAYYIEGLIRGLVRDDPDKYQMARKAYVSMLRAYARLPNKQIFAVKKLDLRCIGKNYGLTGRTDPLKSKMKKTANHDVDRKKRKVQSAKDLQMMQYM